MDASTSRRDFLKLSVLSAGSLAFIISTPVLTPGYSNNPIAFGRVTNGDVGIFQEPSSESRRVGTRWRDELIYIYEVVESPYGPWYNPRWYRVSGGFMHTGYIQRVENRPQPVLKSIPKSGKLFEVSVPFVQSKRYSKMYGWEPLYRLYYQSTHWVTGIDEGPDHKPWYQITDDVLKVNYYAQASQLRPISDEELKPVSADIPPELKKIEVSLMDQTLTAYEEGEIVLRTSISSGIRSSRQTSNGIPTATPQGVFNIEYKVPVRHMGDGVLTSDLEAYELPGVPWVSFFYETGVAFHGTYWHDNFGIPMSRGCVNMRIDEAKWLYRWTTPYVEPSEWFRKGYGTQVKVSV